MKNVLGAVIVVVGALGACGSAWAAKGDPAAGKDKSAVCHGCHGENGMSVAPNFPNLAGQFSGYIKKQVRDFQAGKRNDDTMSAMAATVTEAQDLEDIAAYFMSQKQMKGAATKGSKADKGKQLYTDGNLEKGVYGCKNCHGEGGKGKSPDNHLFPVIGGQNKEYLVKQLQDLKAGRRNNDPAGMMGDIAKGLSDDDIEAVAEYVSGL
jgi:cytochrome c553